MEETKVKKNKIERTVAEKDFIDWCEVNCIDCDTTAMKEDDKEQFENLKEPIIKACMDGRLTFDGRKVKYIISDFTENFNGKEIVIGRPSGKTFMSMDGNRDTQQVRKLQCAMAEMCGQEVVFFSKIDVLDWKVFQAFATLFFTI